MARVPRTATHTQSLDRTLNVIGWPSGFARIGLVLGGQLQTIADPGLGEQKRGAGRRFLDLLAKLVDENAQVIDLIAVVGPPHGLQELPVRQHLVRVGDEVPQQLEFLWREAEAASARRDLA